jgi:hypothetical protein
MGVPNEMFGEKFSRSEGLSRGDLEDTLIK